MPSVPKVRSEAYLSPGKTEKSCNCKCQCDKAKWKDRLLASCKTMFPPGIGMVAALATNEALQCTFQAIFKDTAEKAQAGDEEQPLSAGQLMVMFWYAVLVTIIGAFAVTFFHRRGRSGSCCFGKISSADAKALASMFKIAFALVCSTAWNKFFVSTMKKCCAGPLLLVYAALMTIIGLCCLIATRYSWFKLKGKRLLPKKGNKPCDYVEKVIKYFLCGLALLTPLLFAFLCGLAWNQAFQALILEIFQDADKDTSATLALFAWLYALIVTPFCILGTWLVSWVYDEKQCCGVKKWLADPVTDMLEGEFAAIVAFSFNTAIQKTWVAMFDADADNNGSEVTTNVGITYLYACIITPLMLLLVMWSKRIGTTPTRALGASSPTTRQVASSSTNLNDSTRSQSQLKKSESKSSVYYERAKTTCLKIKMPEALREILVTLMQYTAMIIFAVAWNVAFQATWRLITEDEGLILLFKYIYALIMIIVAFIVAAVAGEDLSFGEDIASW